ncbi:MAG: EpsG family protein [Clostridia bacterium]|nr:EpsG family protein [Clostridia bacterium]
MLMYAILLVPVVLCCIFLPGKSTTLSSSKQRESDKKTRRRAFWLLLPFFVLLALKSTSVGADTDQYTRMFEMVQFDVFEKHYGRVEGGYRLFLIVLTKIFDNPQWQFIIFAAFTLIVFVYFLERNSCKPEWFVLMFLALNLYAFYMTGIRQAFAMTICLLAYEKIKEKKLVWFLLLVALAMSFHTAAMFFIPAYFIAHLKTTKAKIPLYIIVFIIAAIYNEELFMFAGDAFEIEYGIEQAGNGYVMIGLMFIITVLSFLRLKTLIAYNENNKYLIQLNVIHMGLWMLRLFSRTAERPTMFYTFFTILLVEQLIMSIKNKETRAIVNVCVTGFATLYFFYRLPGMGIAPFEFFW